VLSVPIETSAFDSLAFTDLDTHKLIERYGKAKANSVLVCDHIGEMLDRDEYAIGSVNPMIEKLYDRMKHCAGFLTFRDYVEHDKVRLRSANFCSKPLLCQACAIRRGAVLLQSYLPKIELCLANSGLTPWLITPTVKNGPDLRERFEHLEGSFKRLLNNRKCYLKGTQGFKFTEMAKVTGGVYAFETPKAKDGENWHPHLHMLALCTEKPDAGFVNPETGEGWGLRKEWFDITGDSYQFDVSRQEGQPIIKMACEVMKYAVKFSEQDPADTWDAFRALNGKRLVRSFGSLYGVKVPTSLLDAPMSGPYIDRMFSYVSGSYHQVAKVDMTELYEHAS